MGGGVATLGSTTGRACSRGFSGHGEKATASASASMAVDCSNAMSSLQGCTGDECQQCNSGRERPTDPGARIRSFNRRANSSLPDRLMLGANLDIRRSRAIKRARASGLRQANGRKHPSRLLRRGDDIPALVEIETAVPGVLLADLLESPTICSLILRACSSTRAASSIAPGSAHGCEREAQKHRERKCSEQVAREGLQCYGTNPAHRVLISRLRVISSAIQPDPDSNRPSLAQER